MKTQKKTLRGIVTSSVLALSLACGLVPAGAIAYAAETTNPDGIPVEQTDTTNTENAAKVTDEVGEGIGANNSEGTVEGDQDSASASSAAVTEDEAVDTTDNNTDQNTQVEPAQQGYNTTDPNRIDYTGQITQDEVVVVGDVEYEGLKYRLDPDNKTATLIGFGAQTPASNVVIPAQIAAAGNLYTVTNISTPQILGGGVQHS